MSKLADACKTINNANRLKRRQVFIKHTSKELKDFLLQMKMHGYVSSLAFVQSVNKEKALVGLNGRLTKCGAILPRFRYKCDQIMATANALKPARQFGHVIFNTAKGVMDHNEAIEKNAGGSILGFFY